MNHPIRQPNVLHGKIQAWNAVLLGWDNIGPVQFGLDPKIFPIWKDNKGQTFTTPPWDYVYPQ